MFVTSSAHHGIRSPRTLLLMDLFSPFRVISAHKSDVNACCFAADGTFVATGSGDRTVRLFDPKTGHELPSSPLTGHSYYVNACVASPSEPILATGSTDGRIKLWNPITGRELGCIEVHTLGVRSAAFSPDGSYLAAGSAEGAVRVYEMRTRKLVHVLQARDDSILGCSYAPNGFLLAAVASGGEIRLWDPLSGRSLQSAVDTHNLGINACTFSPLARQDLVVWPSGEKSIADSFLLATGGNDNLVKVWNVTHVRGEATLTLKYSLEGHSGPVYSLALSPDGLYLASGSGDKTIIIWKLESGEPAQTMLKHSRYITACAFSPDGHMLATGSNDKNLILWKREGIGGADSVEEGAVKRDDLINLDIAEEGTEKKGEGGTMSGRPAVGECRMAKLLASRGLRPELVVGGWSVDNVVEWLCRLDLSQYAKVFRDNVIDGAELMSLDTKSLADDLGIKPLGHRNKIMRGIQELVDTNRKIDGVPEEFVCPITLDVMKDPVIASDGFTYERQSIQEWLGEGNHTSPMTNLPLTNSTLTPNRQLKTLIEKHDAEHQS